jgi:hypothetical protein
MERALMKTISKFDKAVNDFLAKKKATKKKVHKKSKKIKPPNTPDNLPVSNVSPALRTGITPNDTIAGPPMPLSIGV